MFVSGDVYQPADGGDLVSFIYPTYRFAAAQLQQGILPLWNPTLYAGAPFIGDIQAGFLYIPNLVLFWLWPDFPYPVMQWFAIGHLYWAGLGMYILLRTWHGPKDFRVSRLAALFGAVAFAFCDPLLIHIGNLNLIAVLSWLPWIAATYHLALYHRSLRWAAVAGFLFALSTFAGHAQKHNLYWASSSVIYTGTLGIKSRCVAVNRPTPARNAATSHCGTAISTHHGNHHSVAHGTHCAAGDGVSPLHRTQ